MHFQLAHDVLDVRADGLGRQHQGVRDLLSRALETKLIDDFPLPRGEHALYGAHADPSLRQLAQPPGKVGGEAARQSRAALGDVAQHAWQHAEIEILVQITDRPHPQRQIAEIVLAAD